MKESDALRSTIEALTVQVQVLSDSIDELKSAIRWGTQNDKFGATAEAIAMFVGETVQKEAAGIRDAVNEFSIDAQHVAKMMRETAAKIQMCLFDERGAA